MARHERDACLLRGSKNVAALRNGRRHGLFYHDMLARLSTGNGDIGVQVVRQRNHHRIDIGIGQ
ncbi:Uncharacterised protein [Brucella suis]|nr:hypothetical protein C062_02452 [Brucella suis 92/29]ENR26893.1 hypothetical protein C965_02457 [Brucella suis CNGB 786]ENT26831.1 hypothetical protein B985_02282 [Brucella suis 01-5744]ENT34283.1 hypothetical protein C966_02451 [Brucella suis CNGB 247]KFJ26899.1 hypothetical protein DK66_454 [Brucella suis 1330]SPU72053.1 Uncharacterised protein [Brucella suis]